jgi:hypothetical protein
MNGASNDTNALDRLECKSFGCQMRLMFFEIVKVFGAGSLIPCIKQNNTMLYRIILYYTI